MVNPRTIVSAPSALRTHLKSSAFRRHRGSSCLLISSAAPLFDDGPKTGTSVPISDLVERAKFTVSTELSLVNVQSTIASAYPTMQDIERSMDMAKRAGAKVVIGVGSGSSIDLAKAVATALATESGSDVELIVAPGTLGAAMAASSDTPLIYSAGEEALLPLSFSSSDSSCWIPSERVKTTITLDGDNMAIPQNNSRQNVGKGGGHEGQKHPDANVSDAALASLAICVDGALALDQQYNDAGDPQNNDEISRRQLIDRTVQYSVAALSGVPSILSNDKDGDVASCHRNATAAVMHAGQLLALGNNASDGGRMGIPMSLASSLLPSYFPHGNLLTFLASTMPGLCETLPTLDVDPQHDDQASALRLLSKTVTGREDGTMHDLADWANRISKDARMTPMAYLAEGAPNVHALLERVEANRTFLNQPVDDEEFVEHVLYRSLNR
mmetsp:Transcript_832/g.1277  ORF Transcript_832/g.1277 Transcript_832/m.1277 type:complete len:442 (-) Transcript_832:46-1371(-)|eukprot:CAMPEP_0195521734 /NCGR_PEP_ID=MMETSP0794_2-20130614/19247_1 /TAXON_ID=515487 /ORGANISM="Stephanopyxis turris, Strain CCMP 815" /LENGTH=441 /DNA_ID=CAMNT_0040651349 /DNA_START=186 /DNA_END=1511 /DNA_ORIENTATION=-